VTYEALKVGGSHTEKFFNAKLPFKWDTSQQETNNSGMPPQEAPSSSSSIDVGDMFIDAASLGTSSFGIAPETASGFNKPVDECYLKYVHLKVSRLRLAEAKCLKVP
jgi:hypothetical protein